MRPAWHGLLSGNARKIKRLKKEKSLMKDSLTRKAAEFWRGHVAAVVDL